MEFFPSCDLIVSATASPNFTLTKELIQQTVTEKKQQILIDLAVPRDIEPSVKEIEGMTLYDIDSFKLIQILWNFKKYAKGSIDTKRADGRLLLLV